MATIIGNDLGNIPWEEKPQACNDVMWRYSKNPIINWNPIPTAARVYNSAMAPYKDGFAGVFRGDQKNGRATLFAGFSKDGITIDLNPTPIAWVDEQGAPAPTSYSYDPRVVEIDGVFYITWCDDMQGPSIGLGRTTDFKTFIRMPNPLMP